MRNGQMQKKKGGRQRKRERETERKEHVKWIQKDGISTGDKDK